MLGQIDRVRYAKLKAKAVMQVDCRFEAFAASRTDVCHLHSAMSWPQSLHPETSIHLTCLLLSPEL